MCKSLITLQNCRIENSRSVLVPELSWKMNEGEVWLVIGPNGGGKADFLNALAGGAGGERITPYSTPILYLAYWLFGLLVIWNSG